MSVVLQKNCEYFLLEICKPLQCKASEAKISGLKPPDKKKSTALRCFSFWVPVQTDISIRMEGKNLDKHSS